MLTLLTVVAYEHFAGPASELDRLRALSVLVTRRQEKNLVMSQRRSSQMATVGGKFSSLVPEPEILVLGGTVFPPPDVRYALVARQMLIVGIDLLSVWSGALIAMALRFPLHVEATIRTHVAFLLLYSVLVILFCNTQKLYSGPQFRSVTQEVVAVFRANAMASIFLTAMIYGSGLRTISRLVVILTMLFSLALLAGSRWIRRHRLQRAAADGFTCRNVLIVGADKSAQALQGYLDEHRYLGYVVAGFLTADSDDTQSTLGVLGPLRHLPEIARAHYIDEVIVATQNRHAAKVAIKQARACGLGVRVIPDLYDGLAWSSLPSV